MKKILRILVIVIVSLNAENGIGLEFPDHNKNLEQNLGDFVEAPELTWTAGGDVPWFGQTDDTHDGVDALRSGSITHNQTSWI